MSKTIFIPGGAGYIGSHTAYLLAQQKYNVIVLDNFAHNQIFDHPWATLVKGDLSDKKIIDEIFSTNQIDAVMHFAACIEVGESVKNPQRFYQNNVVNTINLLDSMVRHDVNKIIFSSSCAVYGEPIAIPMNENHPKAPISPYGKNKLSVEFALEDYSNAYGLSHVSLRYFNAAGALPSEGLAEQHDPETHIIPLMLSAINKDKTFKVFGTDYCTPDGSCIRDYIHVLDIANAHLLAYKYLEDGGASDAFNLGSGKGFSVKEMIAAAEKVCGKKMNVLEEDRRPGDPAILLADYSKAKEALGWEPAHSDLNKILSSALESHIKIQSVKQTLEEKTV